MGSTQTRQGKQKMNLTTETDNELTVQIKADYSFQVTMTSGSAKLQMSVDGGAFQDITDCSWTANADGIVQLPACVLKAVVTGDATVMVNLV